MNLFTKQKQTYRYWEQTMVTKGEKCGGGGGGNKSKAWDEHTHTTIYNTDNQQGPPVQHREL